MSKGRKILSLGIFYVLMFLLVSCGTKSYTVIFKDDNGITLDSKTVKKGNDVFAPTIDRDGYELKGWFFEDLEITFPYKVTMDMEFVAVWQLNSVVVNGDVVWDGISNAKIEIGTIFLPLEGVTVVQPIVNNQGINTTRDLSAYIRVVKNDIDNTQPGENEIIYKIEDPDNLDKEPTCYLKENGIDVEVVRKVEIYNKIELFSVSDTIITKGESFDPISGIRATDSIGELDSNDIVILGEVNINVEGEYKLTYIITGSFDDELIVERTITVVEAVLEEPENIYIMSGDVTEYDPFHVNYFGRNKQEKQNLQKEVEEKYNVKIHYIPYPKNAPWGLERQNAIIEAHENGTPLADIYYNISSDWIPYLARNGAIAPLNDNQYIDKSIMEASRYFDKSYGLSLGSLKLETGLYFNQNLLDRLNIENPTEKYLAGDWSWESFKVWAIDAKSQLLEGEYVLGGSTSIYAEQLIPLNGGEFVNETLQKVTFNNQQALETLAFIKELYDNNLFELNHEYELGSSDWKNGKVLFHPGDISQINSWGGDSIEFDLGFVPFPMSDTYIAQNGEYRTPVYGPLFSVMENSDSIERNEMVFNIWYELQLKPTKEEELIEIENILKDRFEKDLYVEAYLTVYDKAYRTSLNGMGISRYSPGSFQEAIIIGIDNGSYEALLSEIKIKYEDKLLIMLNGI